MSMVTQVSSSQAIKVHEPTRMCWVRLVVNVLGASRRKR